MIKSVTLIGAGNLATQLGKALLDAGIHIVQVYSRTDQTAKELATKLNTKFTSDPSNVITDTDLVIVAVKDDAIPEILSKIQLGNQLVVHTAGSVNLNVLEKFSNSVGVFYPLQTFSKIRDISFKEIPVCVEAKSESDLILLKELASKISNHVREIDSEQRKTLHLAAVLTCNFVNHLYHLGDLLLADREISFDLLKPLIQETAAKIQQLKPFEAQTGPAIRFDETIINNHLKMLESYPEVKKIYSFVTESIHKTHNK
ncbi:Rossmann-like and DUF2520 domain-containing protein [Sunxiuqinia sp. A32]|uniref:Rossmann-like and DUF2520 domain-containing protein n=1 Tax=Sunxiuqinia sp. A32 TaxID=3461496 RepID=UPI004045FDF1